MGDSTRYAALGATAVAFALLAVSGAEAADPEIERANVTDVSEPSPLPARYLRTLAYEPASYDPDRTVVATDLLLGDLLFHSPSVLGENAQKLGLSCNSCHPNGAVHRTLRVEGLSDRPGNIDLTTAHFRAGAENHIKDPVNIPSLRGVRFTGPYGTDGRTASLAEFTEGVVTGEFGGKALTPGELAALVRYMHDLDFLPNANLDSHGKLTARASDSARRGEALFAQPRAGFRGESCASCHPASTFFRDGKVHRIGSGRSSSPNALADGYETSTLFGTTESAPYFHDGRFATLAEVVAWFDASFALHLSVHDRDDLTAYLEAVGAVDQPSDTRPLAQRMLETFIFLELLIGGEAKDDRATWPRAIDLVAGELARPRMHSRVAARVADARAKLASLRARAVSGAPLAPMRQEVRDLRRDLTRLAADWAGALAGSEPSQR